MTKPIIRIHDVSSNEIIDREMTDEEFADYEKMQSENAAILVDEQSKAEAKAAIAERLGLSDAELALLLG
jgi:hypothetical protein